MIHKTGYWAKEQASRHHFHSNELCNWLINYLQPHKSKNIFDFGCGMGFYLDSFHKNNFTNLLGIEGDPPKTDYTFDIIKQDLAENFDLNKKGIVISLEVGEHIPKEYQDIFIDNLQRHCSDLLIVSWAIRGQGGHGHFNELNNDEIIPEIEKRGFEYLLEDSMDARAAIQKECLYFKNTILIFKKK